jgi:hypothetical protein
MRKVMIIALDGLEPSLVNETMPNLLQKEHGIINVNVSPLQTPLIWATFLTGTSDNGLNPIKIPYHLGEKVSRIFGYNRIGKIARFTSKLGFNNLKFLSKIDTNVVKQYTKDDIIPPTIFNLVEKRIALNIPAYNENPIYLGIRRNIARTIGGQYPENDLMDEVWNLFRSEFEDCMKMLKTEWELFMVHFFITDVIGHLHWNISEKITECYKQIDHKVGEILRHTNNSFVLILSDHGIQKGLHTNKGFYSVNENTNLNTPKMTDFYDIISKILHHG